MSFEVHRKSYFLLMESVVAGKMPVGEFVSTFRLLWMEDCNAENAQIFSWDEAYDEQLLEAFSDGKMGLPELGSRLRALFGVTDSEARAREYIDRAVTACDLYRPADAVEDSGSELYGIEDERQEYHLDDTALVAEVKAVLDAYKERLAHPKAA